MQEIFEKIIFKLNKKSVIQLGMLMRLYGLNQDEIANRVIQVFLVTETSATGYPVLLYLYRADTDSLTCVHHTYLEYLLSSLEVPRNFAIGIEVTQTRSQMTSFKDAYRKSIFSSASDAFGAALDLYLKLTISQINNRRCQLVIREHPSKPLSPAKIELDVLEALTRQRLRAILTVNGDCEIITKDE